MRIFTPHLHTRFLAATFILYSTLSQSSRMWYDCGTCKKGIKKAPDFQRINEENQKLSLVTRTGIEPMLQP